MQTALTGIGAMGTGMARCLPKGFALRAGHPSDALAIDGLTPTRDAADAASGADIAWLSSSTPTGCRRHLRR
jgi:3-hydroxyisobutyrate dehydrogenase-like beta-hydroxyacid dehydrogenase